MEKSLEKKITTVSYKLYLYIFLFPHNGNSFIIEKSDIIIGRFLLHIIILVIFLNYLMQVTSN